MPVLCWGYPLELSEAQIPLLTYPTVSRLCICLEAPDDSTGRQLHCGPARSLALARVPSTYSFWQSRYHYPHISDGEKVENQSMGMGVVWVHFFHISSSMGHAGAKTPHVNCWQVEDLGELGSQGAAWAPEPLFPSDCGQHICSNLSSAVLCTFPWGWKISKCVQSNMKATCHIKHLKCD